MEIYGLNCLLCHGKLRVLNIIDGSVHTQCVSCNHIARPEIKAVDNNKIYSKFAKKSVDVFYSKSNQQKPEPRKSKSGTFERTHFASAGLRKCK